MDQRDSNNTASSKAAEKSSPELDNTKSTPSRATLTAPSESAETTPTQQTAPDHPYTPIAISDATPESCSSSRKRKRKASGAPLEIRKAAKRMKKFDLREKDPIDKAWAEILLLPWKKEEWKNIKEWW